MTPGHIIFSDGQLSSLAVALEPYLVSGRRLIIVVDDNTVTSCLPILLDAVPELKGQSVVEVPAGESSKSIEILDRLYDSLIDFGADRSSLVINLGGGVVSDIGGLLASTFKRGIPFINIPTSLLAQVDAAIGGKTGINHGHYKNMIGTFALPEFIFIHPEFLNTLPKTHVMSGFAEVIKHALIAEGSLWEEISAQDVLSLPFIKSIIPRAVAVKESIVAADPLEMNVRKKLNFGHTIGHALETFAMESTGPDMLHGEAVALGMICESHISQSTNGLDVEEFNRISTLLGEYYSGTEIGGVSHHRLIEIMSQDKKRRGRSLNMTLLSSIGEAEIDQDPPMDRIIDSLMYLSEHSFGR